MAKAQDTKPQDKKTQAKAAPTLENFSIPDLEKMAHARDDMGANVQSLRIQIINFSQAYSQYHGIRDGKKVTENEDKRVQERAREAAVRAGEAIKIYLREIGKNCDAIYELIGE